MVPADPGPARRQAGIRATTYYMYSLSMVPRTANHSTGSPHGQPLNRFPARPTTQPVPRTANHSTGSPHGQPLNRFPARPTTQPVPRTANHSTGSPHRQPLNRFPAPPTTQPVPRTANHSTGSCMANHPNSHGWPFNPGGVRCDGGNLYITNKLSHIRCPVPNPGHSSVKPGDPRRYESNALALWATELPPPGYVTATTVGVTHLKVPNVNTQCHLGLQSQTRHPVIFHNPCTWTKYSW